MANKFLSPVYMSTNDSTRLLLQYVETVREQQRIIEYTSLHLRRLNDNLTSLFYDYVMGTRGEEEIRADSSVRFSVPARDRVSGATSTGRTTARPEVPRRYVPSSQGPALSRQMTAPRLSTLAPRRRSFTSSLYSRLPPAPPAPPPVRHEPLPPPPGLNATSAPRLGPTSPISTDIVPPRLRRDLTRSIIGSSNPPDALTPRFFGSPTRVRPSVRQIRDGTRLLTFQDVSGSTQTMCPIDRVPFEASDNILSIRHCGHLFREMNLRIHFRNSPRCPLCRYDVRDYMPVLPSDGSSEEGAASQGMATQTSFPYLPGQV